MISSIQNLHISDIFAAQTRRFLSVMRAVMERSHYVHAVFCRFSVRTNENDSGCLMKTLFETRTINSVTVLT